MKSNRNETAMPPIPFNRRISFHLPNGLCNESKQSLNGGGCISRVNRRVCLVYLWFLEFFGLLFITAPG